MSNQKRKPVFDPEAIFRADMLGNTFMQKLGRLRDECAKGAPSPSYVQDEKELLLSMLEYMTRAVEKI